MGSGGSLCPPPGPLLRVPGPGQMMMGQLSCLAGPRWARGQQAGSVCPQRSLEDEINRTTAEDLPIFAVSYLVIFLYMSLALGNYTSWRRLPVSRGREGRGEGCPEPSQLEHLAAKGTNCSGSPGHLEVSILLPNRPLL